MEMRSNEDRGYIHICVCIPPFIRQYLPVCLYIVYPYRHIFMRTYKITFRYTRLPTPSLVHSLHTRSRKHAYTPHLYLPVYIYTKA